MNILEGRPAGYGQTSAVTAYNHDIRPSSPAPTVRSMLDIGLVAPRHGSMVGLGEGIPKHSPRAVPLGRSTHDPSSLVSQNNHNTVAHSTIDAHSAIDGLHRTSSDASSHSLDRRARKIRDRDTRGTLPYSENQFEMSHVIHSPVLPKRVTQGGKKSPAKGSMASIMQGQELEATSRTRNRGRHNSTAGAVSRKSMSPSPRLGNRSQSPGLNTNSFNLMPLPGKFVTDSGKVIDMNNAYRRLSDANLLRAGSNLSSATIKSPATRTRLGSGKVLSPTGELRLQKDYYNDDEAGEAIESSEEDYTSDDESWGPSPRSLRGRRRSRTKKSAGGEDSDDEYYGPVGMGSNGGRKAPKSLLAAAEEERRFHILRTSSLLTPDVEGVSISSQYPVKSLLEPTVTITGPMGDKAATKKLGVHPNTNYNSQLCGVVSPETSDSEDLSDVHRAQRMTIHLSHIDSSIKHRVIRTIVRGEFTKMQQEAEQGSRRLRTYLVASDLSGEAAYALEWTIGTVLRDGDTLMAVYAVDEEIGMGKNNDVEGLGGNSTGEGGYAMQETALIVGKLTAAFQSVPSNTLTTSPHGVPSQSPGGQYSRMGSTESTSLSKAELERIHAIEDISQTCIKFLRKTRLQVRIAVEVIHCKSPKYMITEAVRSSLLFNLNGTDVSDRLSRTDIGYIGVKRPQRAQRVRAKFIAHVTHND